MVHRLNKYAGVPLDRAALRRRDPEWLAEAQASSEARLVPVANGSSFVGGPVEAPRAVFLPMGMGFDVEPVFLGLMEGAPIFAADLSGPEMPSALAGLGRFEDLRAVGPLMPDGEAALCAYARGITWWNARHRFCGVCGAPARSEEGGHVRLCTNPDCGTRHFPRTDPAVIMLIHDGGDRVLLGRSPRFPVGMYSVLAGFVEPGETLEEAVAREVLEEVGLEITDFRYHSSQPWPFPASIMLGYSARAVNFDIRVDPDELEEAHWFTRDSLRDHSRDDSFRLARPDSIARRLIDEWIEQG